MEQYLKKQKIRFTILLVVFLVFVGAIYSVLHSMQRMRADIVVAKNTVATLAASEHMQDANTARARAIQGSVQSILGNIITKDNIPAFLSHIEDIAAAHNVHVAVSNVESTTKDTVPMLHISFSMQGTKDGVQGFLADIQKQTQAVSFSALNMSFDTPAADTNTKKPVSPAEPHISGAGVLEIISVVQ